MLVATSLETARHSDDVELIVGALCENLGLAASYRDEVVAAARLHDVGKTSIPLRILEKPGPLDTVEWELMREHTVVGEQILSSIDELRETARLVRHSHERWDGDGYPDGLTGEKIPFGSRIIFCADSFHAIRSDRPYRKGTSAEAALAEVSRCAGTQFDPKVVVALEEVVRELRIAKPTPRARRSSRLASLLLVLAIGGGGSALARSDLLGEPGPVDPNSAPPPALASPYACASLYCSSIFGEVLLKQLQALGLPAQPGLPAGFGPPSQGSRHHSDGRRPGRIDRDDPDSGGAVVAPNVQEPKPPGDAAPQPPASGGGSHGNGHGNGHGNANGHGNGGRQGGGQGNGNGNSGSGSPGNSGNAPGHTGSGPGGSSPGNSGNAPGHNK